MKSFLPLSAAALAVWAACSPMKVALDFDPRVDFKEFRAFDWLDNRPDAPNRLRPSERTPFDQQVREAVEEELVKRGLSRSETMPDLLVAYYVGEDKGIDVTSRGYRYRHSYGPWGPNIRARVYREGALIIDIIAVVDMTLVWRGSAQNVTDKSLGPQELEGNAKQAVGRILSGYPPVP